MSNKQDVKENEPSLEEWMAKIREKKLKPVVLNKEKEVSQSDKERTKSLQDADDLKKMRQGLRSVSAPKWPGANDVKAKINTTVLPQRAQLRPTTTDRDAPPSNLQTDKGSRLPGSAANRDTPVSMPTTIPPVEEKQIDDKIISDDVEQKQADEKTIPDDWVDVANQVEKIDLADDGDFPLDSVKAIEQAPEDAEIGVSTGVAQPGKSIELKLPAEEDAFPLDQVDKNAETSDPQDNETVPHSPLTASSGAFNPTTGDNIHLTLPKSKENDFPLDTESVGRSDTARTPEGLTGGTSDEIALSSGVFDTTKAASELKLPDKHKKATGPEIEAQMNEIKEAQEQVNESDSIGVKDSVLPSGGIVNTSSDISITEILADHVPPHVAQESAGVTEEAREDVVAEPYAVANATMVPGIKCSKCSKVLELTAMEDHVCEED